MGRNASFVKSPDLANQRQRQPRRQPSHEDAGPAPSLRLQRAVDDPASASPADVLALQHSYGNQAVQRLYRPQIQRAPEDEEEIQTKRADVQRAPEEEEEIQTKPLLQRQGEEEEIQTKPELLRQEEEEEIQTQRLQRAPEEEEEIQTKPAEDRRGSFEAGPGVEDQLRLQKGSGSPLPGDTRQFMESRFGADFSNVRVHSDGQAAHLNRQLSAQAFTHGQDIFMGEGKYSPSTTDGQRLLAHELSHTLQQGGARRKALKRRVPGPWVQRYPANAFQSGANIRWEEDTATAKRSESGRSGVWFYKSLKGPIQELVVKPEYTLSKNETNRARGSQGAAGAILSSLGFETPQSRVIDVSDSEATAIQNTATAKGAPIPANINTERLAYFTILGKASGTSVESATKKATSEGRIGINRLLNQLAQSALLRKIGQLISADVFMGNTDRIGVNMANLGNLMFHGTDLTAIDSDSTFQKLTQRELGPNFNFILEDLEQLLATPDRWADGFIQGVKNWVEGEAPKYASEDFDAREVIDYFNHYPDFPVWKREIIAGIQQGVQKIKSQWASKKGRKGVKEQMGALKSMGATGIDYDTLRVRQKLIELRTAHPDMTEDELKEELAKYAGYRERRARRHKGLKWTAKFF